MCGPRTYLVKTGYKTRYVHAGHLIRAHDKRPNEACEIEISVAQLCDQQIVPVLDTELVSNDVSQPTNEESEPSPCKESSPVILRRSLRNRKPVDQLNL